MIKLIASDLDGTILKNGAQSLPEGFTGLILRLKECGIHFAAASGRQYQNLYRLFGPVADEISYIAENGALCKFRGNTIAGGVIRKDLSLRIMKSILERRELNIMVSCENAVYIENRNPDFVHYVRDVVGYDTILADNILEEVGSPVLKIAACDFHGSSRHERHYREMFRDELSVVTSGNYWFDFVAPDANKGVGLASLLRELHLKPRECMAFGDQYNDVEMLLTAGTSYAMKTCAPGVDRFATNVTDSVEEVLEELLSEYE